MFSAMRLSRFIRHAPLQPPLVGFIGRGAAASIVLQTAADCSSMARHTVALQVSAVRACSLGGGQFRRLLGRAVMGDFRWRGQKPLRLPGAWAGPGAPGRGRASGGARLTPARGRRLPVRVPSRQYRRGPPGHATAAAPRCRGPQWGPPRPQRQTWVTALGPGLGLPVSQLTRMVCSLPVARGISSGF
jgi:hypothetical protein